MSPSTTRNTELPKTALLFTLPVKEQANRMTTPIKININPNSLISLSCVCILIDYNIPVTN